MLLFNSFLFCGFVCMISQIILDNSKLTPGHITSILVVFGAFLDSFSIYDEIIKVVGGGDGVSAVKHFKLAERFNFLSTGGGATLEYIIQEGLPAIDNINEA